MAFESPLSLLVLHGLRLRGFATGEALAALWDLPPEDVQAELELAAAAGHVQHREGRVTGWSLTRQGRECNAELLADELERSGARADVEDACRRFSAVNADLLTTCTSWQLRTIDGEQVVNDHTDADYDRAVLASLEHVHERIWPVTQQLAGRLCRFARYGPGLDWALERVREGDVEWFTKPMIDSYHTLWFELHEDLLGSLGLERSDEARAT